MSINFLSAFSEGVPHDSPYRWHWIELKQESSARDPVLELVVAEPSHTSTLRLSLN